MKISELIDKHLNQTHPLDFGVRALKDYSIELLETVKANPWREHSMTGGITEEDHLSAINEALEELRK